MAGASPSHLLHTHTSHTSGSTHATLPFAPALTFPPHLPHHSHLGSVHAMADDPAVGALHAACHRRRHNMRKQCGHWYEHAACSSRQRNLCEPCGHWCQQAGSVGTLCIRQCGCVVRNKVHLAAAPSPPRPLPLPSLTLSPLSPLSPLPPLPRSQCNREQSPPCVVPSCPATQGWPLTQHQPPANTSPRQQ